MECFDLPAPHELYAETDKANKGKRKATKMFGTGNNNGLGRDYNRHIIVTQLSYCC